MAKFRLDGKMEDVSGLRTTIVHYADETFPFLHDTMIALLGGRLLMAWYNSSEDEIEGRTVIRGRWSADGGESWSDAEVIAEDRETHLHMVPVTFSEWKGEIWAYVTEMTGHDVPVGYRCLRYEAGRWVQRARRDDRALFNTMPQTLWDGRRIVGGRMAREAGMHPEIPMVAFAGEDDPTRWEIVPLPGEWDRGRFPLRYPETAVLRCGKRIEAAVRNDDGNAWIYESADGGKTWGDAEKCALPVEPAKMCAGDLPDGRQFLIFNARTGRGDRSLLAMAVRERGAEAFTKLYRLAEGYRDDLKAGPYWHYPCACVFGDTLCVSCTASGEDVTRNAALIRAPLAAL